MDPPPVRISIVSELISNSDEVSRVMVNRGMIHTILMCGWLIGAKVQEITTTTTKAWAHPLKFQRQIL
jgi:hypothetical protein